MTIFFGHFKSILVCDQKYRFGTGNSISLLMLYTIIMKHHIAPLPKTPLRNNVKKATLIGVSDTYVSKSTTQPVLHAIKALSHTQPDTCRANL